MASETSDVQRLDGKVAIVTGGGGNIGREQALALARQGAKVLVNDLDVTWDLLPGDRGSAERVVKEIVGIGGTATANADSVATLDGAQRIVDAALDAFGRIDIVVNHAGVVGRRGPLWDVPGEEWDAILTANLFGPFYVARAAAPILCRQHSGVIVNMSSTAGFGAPLAVPYGTAHEGIIGLSRAIARELGRFNVRCNAVRPFALTPRSVEYELPDMNSNDRWGPLVEVLITTRGRPATSGGLFSRKDPNAFPASAVATFVTWLCTDAARAANGRTFFVAGNRVALYSEPAIERDLSIAGEWDLDSLDQASENLIGDLENEFLLESHPELQVFE
jgi:NAD(P)-dependent dehydrogenase (short-subunit alcohol dehydrogenase family)